MKPFILILPIIICLIVGCSQQSDVTSPLSPAVDSLVTKFIKTKAKTELIYVAFDKIDNKDYLIISDIETYDDRFVDGYFTHEGKTIAYCSYDTEDRSDLLNQSKTTIFKDTIPGFVSEKQMVSNYASERDIYVMRSATDFAKVKNLMYTFTKATGSNGIKSKVINDKINQYINEHHTQTCLVAFKVSVKGIYMLLMSSLFYQKENADYYFFRNCHPVILYNAKEIDIFNNSDIKIFEGEVPGVRGVPLRDLWFGTTPQLFLITTENNVSEVNDKKKIRDIINELMV